jgi:hypothetical protein
MSYVINHNAKNLSSKKLTVELDLWWYFKNPFDSRNSFAKDIIFDNP